MLTSETLNTVVAAILTSPRAEDYNRGSAWLAGGPWYDESQAQGIFYGTPEPP